MDILMGLEHPEPQRIWQAKCLMRAVTYATQNLAFDRFEDKPQQQMVMCEMWYPDEQGDEWQSWFGVGYDRLDMADFPTAVLLTIVNAENLRDGKASLKKAE